MLDKYLEVLYSHEKTASTKNQMADLMKVLPEEELHRIANGEEKLAEFDCMSDKANSWVDQFQGTPMYEEAMALEGQKLELDIQRQQQNMERFAAGDELSHAEDQIRLQRRILELKKHQADLQARGAVQEEATAPPEPPAPQQTMTQAAQPSVTNTAEEKVKVGFAIALLKMAAAKQPAHYPFDDELDDAVMAGTSNAHAQELARANMLQAVQGQRANAAWASENPIKQRAVGAGLLGALGAAGGYGLGGLAGRPGLGAALGAGAGVALGGHLGSPERQQALAARLEAAHQHMQGPALEQALMGSAKGLAGTVGWNVGDMQQAGKRYMAEARASKKEEKTASVLGAALQGLRGAGGFLGKAAPLAANAAQHGGLKGLGAALKPMAAQGVTQAANFAKANPLAAGAIGAGALGTAALAGRASG